MTTLLQYPTQAAIDPVAFSEALRDEIQWLPTLSEPVLPRPRVPWTWYAIDPATLDDPLRDEIQWFQAFSLPALPRPDLSSIPAAWHDFGTIGDSPVVSADDSHLLTMGVT